MDKAKYQETVKRLKSVNEVIGELDPDIRADGWAMLKPYVIGEEGDGNGDGSEGAKTGKESGGGRSGKLLDVVTLIEEHASDDDAAENGLLAAAILYGTYGHGPYAPKDITAVGEEHHLLMPRMNNFLPRTKREEKKIFRNTNGGWVLTTHGGKWMTATYGVKRGTQTKAD
jgi:hypothetical protein